MNVDEIQNIIDYAYPKIQAYYGKGKINGENFMINTYIKMVCCTKRFLEKTTGKPLPALDKNDYYNFLTLIHELAHCLDFQYQFKQGKIPVAAHKDYFLKVVSHAEFEEIRNAAHMVAGDKNDIFSKAVEKFLVKNN